ncbi:MAG TPA: thioredoxin domain-containing protein [Solirubrobacterales bacterium]|nr:thioredoxin domain-containing protein [Solirubrobacterales bacterium]
MSERRKQLLQMAAGAAFLVAAVVLVLIVVNASSGGDGGDTELEGAAEVNRHLQGIPQRELVLGDANAPVELLEFGDLQCPFCKGVSEEVLPSVIDGVVKSGDARLIFRNFTIIGQESVDAGAAAVAAGKQGRGWSFVEIFYRNQGRENGGFVTDEFLEAVAEAAGVENLDRWNEERKSQATLKEVKAQTEEAQQLGLGGTPTFVIKGPNTDGLEVLGTPESPGQLEAAIEAAS